MWFEPVLTRRVDHHSSARQALGILEGGGRLRKADTSPSLPTRGHQTLVASLRGTGRYPMPTDAIITLMRGPSTDEEAEASAVPTA